MNHSLKFGVAAGTLGLGVATLALVGTGTFASFTAQVRNTSTVTAGSFHMQAVDLEDPITDPAPPTVTPNTWRPTLTPDAITVATTAGTSVVTVTQPTLNPNATYTYQFTVYDSGSLAGIVQTVVYTPALPASTLMNHATISVEQARYNGRSGTYGPFTLISSKNTGNTATAPFPANAAATLHFQATRTTRSLDGYLQPNTATLKNPTTEGAVRYKVTVTLAKTTPNTAMGQSFGFKLTFTGQIM